MPGYALPNHGPDSTMQIRRIILIWFFLLLSVIALPLMAVLFFSSRNSIEEEIGRNLSSDALMLMEEVDMLMFERMQNVHSWSRLDIIQEARIGDIDKRLSQFLADVESGYKGMYRKLYYADARQRVIAASTAEMIGGAHEPAASEVRAEVPNGEVFVEAPRPATPPGDEATLVIRAPVYDSYSAAMIGQFYGLFDMQQLYRLLDKASASGFGERYIVLLDGEGRTLAASANLRKPDFFLNTAFAGWKPAQGSALFVHEGAPISDSPLLVSHAGSSGYLGYARLGWSILIFQSTAEAYLPIRSLWAMFGIVIFMTMVLAFLTSHWLSGHIAKPILALSKWIREVRHFDKLTPPRMGGTI